MPSEYKPPEYKPSAYIRNFEVSYPHVFRQIILVFFIAERRQRADTEPLDMNYNFQENGTIPNNNRNQLELEPSKGSLGLMNAANRIGSKRSAQELTVPQTTVALETLCEVSYSLELNKCFGCLSMTVYSRRDISTHELDTKSFSSTDTMVEH